MKFYLAGKYDKRLELVRIAETLTHMGHSVQAEWLTGSHSGVTVEEKYEYAVIDLADIEACTHFVLFNLPVKRPEPSTGRHVELGYALAKEKVCIIVGSGESVFYTMAIRYHTVEEFVGAIHAAPSQT